MLAGRASTLRGAWREFGGRGAARVQRASQGAKHLSNSSFQDSWDTMQDLVRSDLHAAWPVRACQLRRAALGTNSGSGGRAWCLERRRPPPSPAGAQRRTPARCMQHLVRRPPRPGACLAWCQRQLWAARCACPASEAAAMPGCTRKGLRQDGPAGGAVRGAHLAPKVSFSSLARSKVVCCWNCSQAGRQQEQQHQSCRTNCAGMQGHGLHVWGALRIREVHGPGAQAGSARAAQVQSCATTALTPEQECCRIRRPRTSRKKRRATRYSPWKTGHVCSAGG